MNWFILCHISKVWVSFWWYQVPFCASFFQRLVVFSPSLPPLLSAILQRLSPSPAICSVLKNSPWSRRLHQSDYDYSIKCPEAAVVSFASTCGQSRWIWRVESLQKLCGYWGWGELSKPDQLYFCPCRLAKGLLFGPRFRFDYGQRSYTTSL
jgi:hypothetical protein